MANEQNKRQGERGQSEQSTALERSGGSERGLAGRQYEDPLSAFDTLFERLEHSFFGGSLFDALMRPRGREGDSGAVRVPRVQMRDLGDAIELTAELPGIDPSNVEVHVEDDVLTISGEQHAEEEHEGRRAERSMSFYRQLSLPDGVETDQVKASHKNGMLTIRVPKSRTRTSSRQIPITTEQGSQPPTKERAA